MKSDKQKLTEYIDQILQLPQTPKLSSAEAIRLADEYYDAVNKLHERFIGRINEL
ncbi:MAG: hypothetical protein ACYTFW_00910 [Planctomycetota bacterium]|jgi:hypothetical protein